MDHAFTVQLPGSEVVVRVVGFNVSEQDLEHFGHVFLSVWQRVHESDRAYIEKHWTERNSASEPRLEVHGSFGADNAMATTESSGRVIKFDWQTCMLLSDEALQVLIAHEMGHVYQFSTNKNRLNMTRDDLLGVLPPPLEVPLHPAALVEIHADEMVERWGWDHLLKDVYLLQHFDYKDGQYVRRRKPRNCRRAYNEAKEQRRLSRYDSTSPI